MANFTQYTDNANGTVTVLLCDGREFTLQKEICIQSSDSSIDIQGAWNSTKNCYDYDLKVSPGGSLFDDIITSSQVVTTDIAGDGDVDLVEMEYTTKGGSTFKTDITSLISTYEDNGDGTYTFNSLLGSVTLDTGVQSVTGNIVDNTDPNNPVINETVTTITDNGDNTLTHTSEDGTSVIIPLAGIEERAYFRQTVAQSISPNSYIDDFNAPTLINSDIYFDSATQEFKGFKEGCIYEATGVLSLRDSSITGNTTVYWQASNTSNIGDFGLVYSKLDNTESTNYDEAIVVFRARANTTLKLRTNATAITATSNQFSTYTKFVKIGDCKILTSLAEAQDVPHSGIYDFNINGVEFTAYVDENGYVKIATDYGQGTGALPQSRTVTGSVRGILNPTILAQLTNATEVRITSTSTTNPLDATTTEPAILQRITTNTTIHQGLADNTINDNWVGVGSTMLTGDATINSPSGSLLNENVVHIGGNHACVTWVPTSNYQRAPWSAGEIGANESLNVWVKG